MANIAASPFVLKNATLKIAADNYEAAVSAVEFVPSNPTASWSAINGATTNSVGRASWVVNISGAQDWENPASLVNYLLANDAQDGVAVTFEPIDGGSGFAAVVTLVAPSIGGSVNGIPVFSVSFPVEGSPVRTPGV